MREFQEILDNYDLRHCDYINRCRSVDSLIKRFRELVAGSDYMHYCDANGEGWEMFDVDNIPITKGDLYDTCKGYYDVWLGCCLYKIRVYCEIELYDFNPLEGNYDCEAITELGWDFE